MLKPLERDACAQIASAAMRLSKAAGELSIGLGLAHSAAGSPPSLAIEVAEDHVKEAQKLLDLAKTWIAQAAGRQRDEEAQQLSAEIEAFGADDEAGRQVNPNDGEQHG